MNMADKVALVTGANKGLGFETSRQLAALGIAVVMGCRNEERGKEAAAKLGNMGHKVYLVRLDVTDYGSISDAARYVEETFGRLDILVNNAGINLEWGREAPTLRTSEVSLDMIKITHETNFLGTIAVTQSLLPLIRKSAAGRIVNVSSILGSMTFQRNRDLDFRYFRVFAYSSSKTALNAFTIHLAFELRDTPIKVNSAHPGWVRTDMGTDAAPVPVEEGALTIVRLATLPDDGPTGGFFHMEQPLPW